MTNILQKLVTFRITKSSFMLTICVSQVVIVIMTINYIQLAITIDILRCYLGKFRESFSYQVLPLQKAP